jgi:uncharacterized protein (DUF1330 family)
MLKRQVLFKPINQNTMKQYFVAQIKINDHDEYEKYLENFDEIFSKYDGEYLAVDESPTVLGGTWDYTKSVLVEFNTREKFEAWYYSDDYQKILKYRLRAAKCDTILLEGLE